MDYSNKLRDKVEDALTEEFERVAIGEVLAGGNGRFEIRPSFAFTMGGDPYLVYGIYNARTGIREADAMQYKIAKDWVASMTRLEEGEYDHPTPSSAIPVAPGHTVN